MREGPIEQQDQEKITDAMDQIKGDPADDIAKACPKASCNKIGDGAKSSEKQAEKTCNNRPKKGMASLFQQQDNHHQKRPDIKIIDPPDMKSIDQPFHQYKDAYCQ